MSLAVPVNSDYDFQYLYYYAYLTIQKFTNKQSIITFIITFTEICNGVHGYIFAVTKQNSPAHDNVWSQVLI